MARTGIIINQVDDPSTGSGWPAGIGSILLRENGGTTFGELWRKDGAGDTDWTLIGSVTPATDPGDIADPTLATPESNALKINALFANLRTAGMLA